MHIAAGFMAKVVLEKKEPQKPSYAAFGVQDAIEATSGEGKKGVLPSFD